MLIRLAIMCALMASTIVSAETVIDAPPKDEFVLDLAETITSENAAAIRELGKKLQADLAVPLCVVTVKTQTDYGTFKDIEAFARHILDRWISSQADRNWKLGVILVLASQDRKVRIQLGGDWKHSQDQRSDAVMKDVLIPKLKAKDFSGAMADGASALEKMVREALKTSHVEVEERK